MQHDGIRLISNSLLKAQHWFSRRVAGVFAPLGPVHLFGFGSITPFPAPAGYRGKKAAQIAQFFASQEDGIEKLKLIKLIYLSERAFISEHGHPMLYDELFSLKHGPICSSTLNGIDGQIDRDIWSKRVTLKNNRNIHALSKFNRDNLDEISDGEFSVLQDVWKEFGKMDAIALRDWTHKNCPEYTEVDGGRIAISYPELFKALGIENSDKLAMQERRSRRAASIFRVK